MASAAYHHKPNSLLYLISHPLLDHVEIKEFSRHELESAFRLGPKPPRPVKRVEPELKRAKVSLVKQDTKVKLESAVIFTKSNNQTKRKQKVVNSVSFSQQPKRARKLKPSSTIKKHFLPLIQHLMCKEISPELRNPFNVKMTKTLARDIAPGYHKIVQKPMDFRTIEGKMKSGRYTTAAQFAADVSLVFDNCVLYNGPSHEFTLWAEGLRTEFTEKYDKILSHEDLEDLRGS